MDSKSQKYGGLVWATSILAVILVIHVGLIGYTSIGSSVDSDGRTDVAMKGAENAPVTIIEWSDFECPFCTRFYQQTLPQIEEEYVATGKVKLIYKDFPLNFHENAQKAAEAGKCALEQGKFWEMHDRIFDGNIAGQKPTVQNLKAYAAEINLDTAEFNECLDSGRMASKVAAEMREGQQAGVRGTPGFSINGEIVSGAQPFSDFQKVIDAKLAE